MKTILMCVCLFCVIGCTDWKDESITNYRLMLQKDLVLIQKQNDYIDSVQAINKKLHNQIVQLVDQRDRWMKLSQRQQNLINIQLKSYLK